MADGFAFGGAPDPEAAASDGGPTTEPVLVGIDEDKVLPLDDPAFWEALESGENAEEWMVDESSLSDDVGQGVPGFSAEEEALLLEAVGDDPALRELFELEAVPGEDGALPGDAESPAGGAAPLGEVLPDPGGGEPGGEGSSGDLGADPLGFGEGEDPAYTEEAVPVPVDGEGASGAETETPAGDDDDSARPPSGALPPGPGDLPGDPAPAAGGEDGGAESEADGTPSPEPEPETTPAAEPTPTGGP